METCLFSERSVLLPTNIMITSDPREKREWGCPVCLNSKSKPRSFRTSSIHFDVLRKDARSD